MAPPPSYARGAAVVSNDVVIAGRVTTASETNAGLARYGTTGLNTTFGTNGTASFDMADSETANGIANIGTGFVFVESMLQATNEYFMVVRVQANGAANTNFGWMGRFMVGFAGYGAQGYGLVVTPNSQIVAVGSARTSTGHNRMAMARVNGGGTLDTTFSDDGYTMISAGGEDAVANAVALQSTGRIVAGGGHVRAAAVRRSAPFSCACGASDSAASPDPRRSRTGSAQPLVHSRALCCRAAADFSAARRA